MGSCKSSARESFTVLFGRLTNYVHFMDLGYRGSIRFLMLWNESVLRKSKIVNIYKAFSLELLFPYKSIYFLYYAGNLFCYIGTLGSRFVLIFFLLDCL
jgi:hypothetical protein